MSAALGTLGGGGGGDRGSLEAVISPVPMEKSEPFLAVSPDPVRDISGLLICQHFDGQFFMG